MARNGHLPTIQPPETIFVSGSRSIRSLSEPAREQLDRYITSGSHFVVGDAPGFDTALQQYFAHLNYPNVTVYHIGDVPRNNFGFPTFRVAGHRQSDKDAAMAKAADRGLAVWDGKSPGTKQNIARLPTEVIAPPVPVSARGEQARSDVIAQSTSEDVRALYNVPEGLTRGQHTSALHHQDPFVRDEFERGATVSDAVLSIPRDPDSRSTDSSVVKIGTESHAIAFVSGFVADPNLAREKGEKLYQLAEKACGQWTETNGRWQTFTAIYDLVRKDENGKYRTNDEKALVIDQVLDSIAAWADHLPAPVPEPTAEEVHQYTLELAAENQQQIHSEERDEPDLTTISATDPRLLYVHELNANSRGLATISELTNFTLEDAEPEISVDETQVYADVFENVVLDAADLASDHLGAEIPSGSGGPALDATFDRINLDALPPTIPANLSEQTQTYLLDSLIPAIDAEIDRGATKQQLLSAIYKENRASESERFNQKVEHAFDVRSEEQSRSVITREDRLNALTSLRLLLAGEYKRETRGFSRDAIEWAKANYRLNPDALRAAGKLKVLDNGKVSEYQNLVQEQTNARTEWVRTHPGQQAPYRAQVDRINELETAGHQVNNRIDALNPSKEERLSALRYAQANLAAARDQTQSRLNDFAQADARASELKLEADRYADAARNSDQFAAAKSLFLHNEHERSIDERQEASRGNNPRFDYLSETSGSRSSALGQLKAEHQTESQAERAQLAGLLIDPRIEAEQLAVAAEIRDHQSYFTQLAGREIGSPAEAQTAIQPRLSNLDSVISFAGNSINRLDPTNQTTPELAPIQAPIYVSLVSNEQLRIPVTTLPEYDALTNAAQDCHLQTDTWRSLHSPAPVTGRDEERDALAMFVGDYIDFRQSDHATVQLNENRVFREYAQRLNDTRTTDELIAAAVTISKENFANYQQQEAHRANPETTLAPATPPLSLKDMRQVFLTATPTGVTKSETAAMRSILVSTVFGKEKTDRIQLLATGQLQPSPTLAKLLDNLQTRHTAAAVNHFYASLQNPKPDRANAFNLYEAHRSLPQFEKDYLHQYALKEKYESLKAQPDRTTEQTQQPLINNRAQEPSITAAAKATTSYAAYYGQADWREATLCASALAQQEGLTRTDLDRSTIAPEISDLDARAISYAVHNFDQTRQTQVVQHLQSSDDRHQQTLGDMLALASEAHHAGGREVSNGAINLPSDYPLSLDSAEKVVSFALQPNDRTLHPQDLASARQLAQHETWNQLQQSLISDPALLVDASTKTLNEARELHQLVRSAAELQDRARTAFAVRDAHFNSCLERATTEIKNAQLPNSRDAVSTATVKDLVTLVLHPDQQDRNGVSKSNAQELQVVRGVISQTDIQKAAELSQFAASARNEYLQTFPKLDTAQTAIQNSQTQLAETVVASYEQAAKEATSASSRFASVRDQVERTLIGEQLGQVFNSSTDLNVPSASARDLLPPDVLAQAAATAREEAWQSFEPQEIRDDRAGTPVDERTLNAAYLVMDQVENARTLEPGLAEANQLDAAFQQIDAAIDRLEITRAEVHMEQQLAPYEQIAQPVAERVNEYLKTTTKDEGLKAILEPIRHEGHVEKIALAILETAQESNVQLGHSSDSIAQVHQVASTLFEACRDGMERANQHLIQGMQLTAELQRTDVLSNQQPLHDLHNQSHGQHGLETLKSLDKASNGKPAADRLLDLTKGDPLKDNPVMEYDDASRTSELTQSQTLNNSGTQATALTQNQPAQEEASHVLDLVL